MKTILIISLLLISSLNAYSQTKYILPCGADLLEASLDSAMAQVGTVEKTGRNDGPVEKYLSAVGLSKGAPYCAAGQYWCFFVGAKALALSLSEIPILRTGVANAIFNDAARKGSKVGYSAEKHDLIVWRRRGSYKGHVERILETGRAGWVKTVGFNTRSGNNAIRRKREGVFIRRRNIYHPIGRLSIRGLVGFERI